MKTIASWLCSAVLAAPLIGSAAIHAEAGASVFWLRETRPETSVNLLSVDEPTKVAPFVAATWDFGPRFGLRFSYQYLKDAETTARYSLPPAVPTSSNDFIWGHYEDDVHVVSAAPEFRWTLAPTLSLALAPQVNWVASRGVVSYSSTNPTVLLIGPRERDDDGFTLGGSMRFTWSIGRRAAIAVGYQYLDLDPSFDREAHVLSGGVRWTF